MTLVRPTWKHNAQLYSLPSVFGAVQSIYQRLNTINDELASLRNLIVAEAVLQTYVNERIPLVDDISRSP